ncbi:MAG: methyl-accepting chemotaxis protein [Gammaproteobacteria bacterium]
MFTLNHLRIGPRLAISFGLIAATTLAIGIYGVNRLANLTDSLTLIGEDRMPKVSQLSDNVDHINLIARELRNTLIFDEPADVNSAIAIVRETQEKAKQSIAPLKDTIKSEDGLKRLNAMNRAFESYRPLEASFISLIRSNKKEEAENLLTNKLRPAQLEYFNAVGELKKYQIELVQTAVQAGHEAYKRDRNVVAGMLFFMTLVSMTFAVFITRSIILPIRRAVASSERIAHGDLTEVLDVQGRDEAADLLGGVRKMQESLREVVGQVRNGMGSVTMTSKQIAEASVDLSHRTENQAVDLQRTAASIEEITSTVMQTASNADQANESAKSASEAASRGGEVVREVVTTMEEIRESSRHISDIVAKIDDIAFQTNILALNAAVEAARAGDQGRGFAVVASEVRTLAENSAKAAKEIGEMIENSSQKVETGGRRVVEAGEAMDDIVKQVRQVTGLVGDITTASQEQSSGISEINDSVVQMDSSTQQNAAMSEESAAAAQLLSTEAQTLSQVVAVFKLDTNEPSPGRPAAVAEFPGASTVSSPHRQSTESWDVAV